MIAPAPLQKGDTIGVMSPSSYIDKDDVEKAVQIIEGYGYNVYIHPQTLAKHNQSAGTNEEKLSAFHDLIENPNIKAIIFSTGGNRALHWVDQIDVELVRQNPKILMGFSDITSILNLVSAKTGLTTFHGPNLRWFMVYEDNKQDIDFCFEVLSNPNINLSSPLYAGIRMPAQGGYDVKLVGGNLSLFQYLTNDIDFKNKTLFLEDRYIEISRLDRMFCHLRRQGVFDKVNGLILGNFSELLDTERPYGFTCDDIIAEHVPKDLPTIKNAPFGHGSRLMTFPISG